MFDIMLSIHSQHLKVCENVAEFSGCCILQVAKKFKIAKKES
jgi:hypothetical protein